MPTHHGAVPRSSRTVASSSSSGNKSMSLSPGKLRKNVQRLLNRSPQQKKESRSSRSSRTDMPATLPLNEEASTTSSQPETQRRRSRSSGAAPRQRTDRPSRNRSTSADKSRRPGEPRPLRRRLKRTSTSKQQQPELDSNTSVAGSETTATTASTCSTYASSDSRSTSRPRVRFSEPGPTQRRSTTQRRVGRRQPPQRFHSDSLTVMQQQQQQQQMMMMKYQQQQQPQRHHPSAMMGRRAVPHRAHSDPRQLQQLQQQYHVHNRAHPANQMRPRLPPQHFRNGPPVINDPRCAQDYGQVYHANLDNAIGEYDVYNQYAHNNGSQYSYEDDERTQASRRSMRKPKTVRPSVRFSVVEVFEHPTTVGVEPVPGGPALTMQWKASGHWVMQIDNYLDYVKHAAKMRNRSGKPPPALANSTASDTIYSTYNHNYVPLTATERYDRLTHNGVPFTKIQSSMLESQYTYQQRLETKLTECILDLKTQRQNALAAT